MDQTAMENRIAAAYIAAGMPADDNWYHEAHEDVRVLADKHGIDFHVCAAIVAALSPRVRWLSKLGKHPNLEVADSLIKGYRHKQARAMIFSSLSGFDRNKRKAWDILRTNDPSLLSGPKVTAFYNNIIDPDNDDNVTVDSWMVAIAYGLDWTGAKNGYSPNTIKQYNAIKQALINVAEYFAISAVDLQAIVWQYAKTIAGQTQYRVV